MAEVARRSLRGQRSAGAAHDAGRLKCVETGVVGMRVLLFAIVAEEDTAEFVVALLHGGHPVLLWGCCGSIAAPSSVRRTCRPAVRRRRRGRCRREADPSGPVGRAYL